jgi:hypothetical protein
LLWLDKSTDVINQNKNDDDDDRFWLLNYSECKARSMQLR